MPNSLDYLDWRGDLRFSESPFNEVDMFLCSQLSTPDYTSILTSDDMSMTISEVSEKYFQTHDDDVRTLGFMQSDSVLPMLKKLPECERYKNTRLRFARNTVNHSNTEQFCAVTIELDDGTTCVSFRGTDDTIIAWKEDFNLATKEFVPAQKDALDYLRFVASKTKSKLRICGHSKGGNLSIYSAVHSPKSIRNRIISIYSFDGPGFSDSFFLCEGYPHLKSKIVTVLSQNSIVGTLLNRAGSAVIVESSRLWPFAHDGFTWEVLGKDFVRSDGLSEVSKTFELAMAETLSKLSTEEKQAFVDDLFSALMSTGARTVSELAQFKISSVIEIMKNMASSRNVYSFLFRMGSETLKAISGDSDSQFYK